MADIEIQKCKLFNYVLLHIYAVGAGVLIKEMPSQMHGHDAA